MVSRTMVMIVTTDGKQSCNWLKCRKMEQNQVRLCVCVCSQNIDYLYKSHKIANDKQPV